MAPRHPNPLSFKILALNPYNSKILAPSPLQLHCFHRPEGEGVPRPTEYRPGAYLTLPKAAGASTSSPMPWKASSVMEEKLPSCLSMSKMSAR